MTSRKSLTGLVLAGGGSRRMGADKARLPVGDTPLAVHVARRLEPICRTVLLASGDGRRLSDLGYPEVADIEADRGPLAGIVAGLAVAPSAVVAVVAVDMPYASADVLSLLAEQWRGEDAVIPSDGERLHPLHGIYAAAAAETLHGCLRAGIYTLREALGRLEVTVAGPTEWRHLDPVGRFLTNVNEPEELTHLAGR